MLVLIIVAAEAVQAVFPLEVQLLQMLFLPQYQVAQADHEDTTKDLETLVVRAAGLQVVDQVADIQTVQLIPVLAVVEVEVQLYQHRMLVNI